MRFQGDVKDLGLAIHLLCGFNSWSLADLSRHSGVDRGLLSDYVNGTKTPNSRNLDRILAAFRIDLAFLEQLMPAGRRLREAYQRARAGQAGALAAGEAAPGLAERIGAAAMAAMAPCLLRLSQLGSEPSPCAEDRVWAEEVWSRFALLPPADQDLWVEVLLGDERSWALALQLCEASEAAAADRADEALRLVRLALRLAEHAPGEDERFSLLLRGWAEPFVANAERVGGDFSAAAATLAHADQLWSRGQGGDPKGLLDATRRLDLKASLLMYQDGQAGEALSLLDQASAGAPAHTRGRLLLKKARAQEIAGENEVALATLREAEPLIDAQREPRLLFALQFNRAVNYLALDRYAEAEGLLPVVESLVAGLGTELDGWRVVWLKGRTWLGLERRKAALEALTEVRDYFLAEKIAYDFSVVSLELATLHAEEGRTRLVKKIAKDMYWIFKGQQVHENALAALTLFCQAAEKEKAGAEWTRELVKYLYRAQHRPELVFGG